MRMRLWQWSLALIVASLMHVVAVAALVALETAAPAPKVQTYVIELGAGGEPAGGTAAPGELAPADAAMAPLAPLAAAAMVEPPPVVKTETVKPKPKPKPKSKPKPKPKPKAKPKPKPKRSKATKPSRSSTAKTSTHKRKTAAGSGARSGSSARGSGGRGAGHGRGGKGSGSGHGSGGGGSGKSSRGYLTDLARALNRYKRYPSRARRLRQQGTVKINFTIDRNGRVLSHRIVGSSGSAILDQEVESMIRRAKLPPIPKSMGKNRLNVTVPIRFQLR